MLITRRNVAFLSLLFLSSLNANAYHSGLLKGRVGFVNLNKSISHSRQGTTPAQQISNGMLGELALTKFISSNFAVELGLGYSFLKTKGSLDPRKKNSNLIPIKGFLQFHIPMKNGFTPYIGTGYAYQIIQNTSKEFKVKKAGGLGYQIGADLFVSENLGVNLDCKYAPIKHRITDAGEHFRAKLKTLTTMVGVVMPI